MAPRNPIRDYFRELVYAVEQSGDAEKDLPDATTEVGMTGHDGYLATGFRDVDNNSDVGKLAACLRFLEGLPSFHAYKKMSIERLNLKPGDTAVDIGCGLGFDVTRLAKAVSPGGLSIGIDGSETLLNEARSTFGDDEGVSFRKGDIRNLEIPSNIVDGIRVDRTLQHVQDPQRVISEMVRVLKPGGRMVCAEPDWSTFVVDADNEEITDRVIETWESSFKNPRIGRQLLRRIRAEGLEDTWTEGLILLADGLKTANMVYDIYATAEKVKDADQEKALAVDAWVSELRRRDAREGVMACVTIFLAGGRKSG